MTNIQSPAKAVYCRPELTVFGSVRNLTGGSSGSCPDATGIRTPQVTPGICPIP